MFSSQRVRGNNAFQPVHYDEPMLLMCQVYMKKMLSKKEAEMASCRIGERAVTLFS